MDAYEEFNKIKTLEELSEFAVDAKIDKIEEIYESIRNQREFDSYAFSHSTNQFTIELIVRDIVLGVVSDVEVMGLYKEIKFEECLELSESVIANRVELYYKEGIETEENQKRFIDMFITSISLSLQNKEKKEIEKVKLVLLAQYIFNNKDRFKIEVRDITRIQFVALRLIEMQKELKSALVNSNIKIEESNNRIDNIEPKLIEAKEDIQDANDKIKNINNNMVTIMALFLTAFSIIGVNIYSLDKKFEVNQIVLINSSLVFVLSFLMYLLDKIINAGKANLGKIVIWAGVVLMVVGFIEPIISKFI